MGYQTLYTLSVHEGEETIEDILKCETEDSFPGLGYALYRDGEPVDAVKWYGHEIDMLELSKSYPFVVFVLKGEGEESGDIWMKYFKNGKMYQSHAVITFAPYDENKLR